MELLHSLPPHNFCGLEGIDYKKAKFVVLPVPYDSTTSYRSGTRNGPHAMIEASRSIERYDIELSACPLETGIYTTNELEPSRGSSEETVNRVEDAVRQILADSKIPVMFGGEHSITAGAVRAFDDKSITVLQIDAHSDLREEFEGSKYSHACAMRRVRDTNTTVQVGVRSMSEEESKYVKKEKPVIFYGRNFTPKEVVSKLGEKVYITIDLDGLDPSIMPAVGTPEPGGLFWDETLALMKEVCAKRTVVGFDAVELCPIPGNVASDFAASLLVYKIIGYIGKKRGWL
ncbi:MAG: agmatinase [Candidatus Micrarchaeota archaeon]